MKNVKIKLQKFPIIGKKNRIKFKKYSKTKGAKNARYRKNKT